MAVEYSHGFKLWAVPRFRRSHAIVQHALNTERTLEAASAIGYVRADPANLSIIANNAATTPENSEAAADVPACSTGYH